MRADRLLLQRLRKSQSGTALYGDAQVAAEECAQEPSVYSAYEGAASQRLIVVANRLPVSAFKDRDGRWALQACPHPLLPHLPSTLCHVGRAATHCVLAWTLAVCPALEATAVWLSCRVWHGGGCHFNAAWHHGRSVQPLRCQDCACLHQLQCMGVLLLL